MLPALASCRDYRWPDNQTSSPGSPRCPGGGCPPEKPPDPYAGYAPREARALAAAAANEGLATSCGGCHGAEAVQNGRVEAAIDNIDRIEQLVEGPWVSQCSSVTSPLVTIASGGDGGNWRRGADTYHRSVLIQPLPPQQVLAIADFIDRDCNRLAAVCEEEPSLAGCRVLGVEGWLEGACGECHGLAVADAYERFFSSVGDMKRMVSEGKWVPCQSEGSLLIQYMDDPPSEPHRVAAEDVQRVATFIDDMTGLCAPAGLATSLDVERTTAESMLRRSCGECHGGRPGDAAGADGGLARVDDIGALIETGYVYPCAQPSRIVSRMLDGSMPPPGSGAPTPSLEEIDQLISVIERPCARPGSSSEGAAWRLAERARLDALAAPPPPIVEMRPDVPPLQDECFEYLGDWIRCEHAGLGEPGVETIGFATAEECMSACRERSDCTAITDWAWLGDPEIGCRLYLAACDAPSTGVWHEEDGGRQYRKTCAP